jgi:hypothetical protein
VLVSQPPAQPPAKHYCWSYDDRQELEAVAREFLGEGLAAGEMVWFAASGGPGGLAGWLAEAARADPGAVRFVPLEAAYPSGARLDPSGQVAAYAEATAAALGAGYRGLRVVADCTAMVHTPADTAAFARYEALVDGFIAEAPIRAVCGFSRVTLGDGPIAELACLHPGSNAPGVRFPLRAGPSGGPAAVLAGEVDFTSDELFATALSHVRPAATGGRIEIDASELRFADHRVLLHLHRYAAAADATAVLRTRRATLVRLAELVGADRVRVEAAP